MSPTWPHLGGHPLHPKTPPSSVAPLWAPFLLHHQHALPGGRLHVHVVNAGARSAHHLQPLGRLQDLGGDFGGRAHDEPIAVLEGGTDPVRRDGLRGRLALPGGPSPVGAAGWELPLPGAQGWDRQRETSRGSCIRREEAGTGPAWRGGPRPPRPHSVPMLSPSRPTGARGREATAVPAWHPAATHPSRG